MTDSLSIKQAKKIVLLSQVMPKGMPHKSSEKATLAAVEQLSYIQIDTIARVERAHHHTLWNRVKGYQPELLDKLQRKCEIFEHWYHAAAYLPISDFRYCQIKMQQMIDNEKDWHEQAKKIKAEVLARITAEGPLQSKDFEDKKHSAGQWWDWKPAKRALELLFLQGKLMVERRVGFQKVFDLTERVLPSHIDTSMPTQSEYAQYLIKSYLKANGLGNETEFGYLRTGMQKYIKQQVAQLLEKGEIIKVKLGDNHCYTDKKGLSLLDKRMPKAQVKLLSPFDNLVIQRKRLSKLFGYNYQLECYLKEADRKFGYFCLPILWGDEFVGRLDAKADRKNKILLIYSLYIEYPPIDTQSFVDSLKSALDAYAEFNQCLSWQLQKCDHKEISYYLLKS
ncbi:YcaQ family DNA glycosylase [Zooshikella marina]|uniref:winged helix-turn-helix domain-containing protein n=1 Tax=Zooshikella ganghwensis TaxID=202772 RepID=UPI001BAF8198|nr:crosslink repair DNA glycosylase YcaQ family protein [Zooshikella ganghwensis]MBU2705675.1 YcaQ family DNA glycosylase [Zooshikella ganghwensis]